jgi:rhodanese-related sulfurtransferase
VQRFAELDSGEFETAVAAAPRPFVVDIRDAAEFEAGHVPGSMWIHVHEIAAKRGELPVSRIRRVLVVGDGGKRTQAAATWLVLTGYADVAVLSGGFAAWRGPVEKGPPAPPKPQGPQLRVV